VFWPFYILIDFHPQLSLITKIGHFCRHTLPATTTKAVTQENLNTNKFGNRTFEKLFFHAYTYLVNWAVDKAWIGPDRIGSDRTDKTWIRSYRTHKTWMGSNSFKETCIYSLKVGAFQIPTKNGQVVSLDQDDEEKSRKWLRLHYFCLFFSNLSWRLFVYCCGFTLCKLLQEKNSFSSGRDLSRIIKREGTDSVCQSMYS